MLPVTVLLLALASAIPFHKRIRASEIPKRSRVERARPVTSHKNSAEPQALCPPAGFRQFVCDATPKPYRQELNILLDSFREGQERARGGGSSFGIYEHEEDH